MTKSRSLAAFAPRSFGELSPEGACEAEKAGYLTGRMEWSANMRYFSLPSEPSKDTCLDVGTSVRKLYQHSSSWKM